MAQRYQFAEFELDAEAFELRRDREPIPVEPQVFELLRMLVEHRHRVVLKDEILDRIWPERYISEAALSSRLMAARKALSDTGKEQRFIKTIHGRGYRFVHPATEIGAAGGELSPISESPPAEEEPPGPPPAVNFATTSDGVHLAYSVLGDGLPLVRTIGWVTHLELEWQWPAGRRFWQRLGQHHRLVRYDGRGMGLSDPAEDLSLETRILDLEGVVDGLGLERFAILGISAGVYQAVKFAAKYPERVSHLVLYGGGPDNEHDEAENIQWIRYWEPLRHVMRTGWDIASPVYRRLFTDLILGENTDPADVDAFNELQRSAMDPRTASRFIAATLATGVGEAARQVKAPTLVVHRRDDMMVPTSRSRRMASLIPGARFHTLEGNAHWPMVQGAEEFAQLIDDFTGGG
jgi:pimeloyl-ACP methyl ester carboxylesterase/DNA-binding winged helix-turn-helix (wHTH) protein